MTTGKIAAVRRLLDTGEVSCAELTRRYLDAIGRDNERLNAYVTVTAETALAAAEEVDRRRAAGEAPAPLEGVPMTLKDNISTAGIETTCCSRILKGYRPIYDATVWRLLQGQHAVLLGKTNMDEFAMGSSCETSCFGGANNPYDQNHVAGGSSGGVASAVGGNLAVYGLGSDTGGSIRQPASFCGLVGLKPTYGAVSRYGLIAYASSFDQIGPITASVEDAALVYDAISPYDQQDSTSQGRMGPPTAEALGRELKGLRVGIAKEYFEGLREDVRAAVEEAVAGAEPVKVFVYDMAQEGGAYTCGDNFTAKLISHAGGVNIFEDMDTTWATVSWEEVVERAPEVIVINDYGSTSLEEKIEELKENPALADVPAIRDGRITSVTLCESFASSMTGDTIEKFARSFHPDCFQ